MASTIPMEDQKTMTYREIEAAAIRAHAAGETWVTFWHRHAADVAALEPDDYFARGQLVHRLVGLVSSGDTDGMTAAGDSAPWHVDDPPAYPASDNLTVARCLWQPGQEATR